MAASSRAIALMLLVGAQAAASEAPRRPTAERAPRLLAARPGAAQGQRVNADAKLMVDFSARVAAYSSLHRKLEGTLTDLPKEATAQQIDTHQIALAQLIGRSRVNAKAGDIFTKEVRALFRRSLARVFAGREGAELKAVIMDENPGRIRLSINSRYPDAIPVTTMPAPVLEALPKLPEELEYRFIGDRLILFDVHAHTIVDLLEDAFPR